MVKSNLQLNILERGFYLKKMKSDKGQASLNLLLSVVTALFVIGIIVMVFVLMGSELASVTDDETASGVINDTTQALAGVTSW